jgi:hypothetical protein
LESISTACSHWSRIVYVLAMYSFVDWYLPMPERMMPCLPVDHARTRNQRRCAEDWGLRDT